MTHHSLAGTMLAFFLFINLSTHSQKINSLSPQEFEEQIKNAGIQLLDVRTMGEYNAGHIKNALQADWLNKELFIERIRHLEKNQPVYIYCARGPRSEAANQYLHNAGFAQVFELKGGFIEWKKNNKPVEAIVKTNPITLKQFNRMVAEKENMLVNFGAVWCPPCKKMEPILEQFQKQQGTAVKILNIDAGIETELLKTLNINVLPTFVSYKNGKETSRKEGVVSLNELNNLTW